MTEIKKQRKKYPPVMRRYVIGGVTYIVTARQSERATEDAKTKILRLIKNDARRAADPGT